MIAGIISLIVISVTAFMLFGMSRMDKYPIISPESLREKSYKELCTLHLEISKLLRDELVRRPWLSPSGRLYENYEAIKAELIRMEQSIGHRYTGSQYGNYQTSYNGLSESISKLMHEAAPVSRKKAREKIQARKPINPPVKRYRH